MFEIKASEEVITKKKKRVLILGLLLMLVLAALAAWPGAGDSSDQLAQAGQEATITPTPPDFTSTPTSTMPTETIPQVRSTNTATSSPTPTSAPATRVAQATVRPTPTTSASTAESQPTTTEPAGNGQASNQLTPESVVQESGPATVAVESDQQEGGATSAETGSQTGPSETSTGQEGSSGDGAGYGPIVKPGETVITSEGDAATAPSTEDTASPAGLPATGFNLVSWGMFWVALGTILLLVGVGITAARNKAK
jgi:hypothetical protein